MKLYKNDQELILSLAKGCQKLTDSVSPTLGPKGRNVIIQSAGAKPIITKDGVTVAKFISLEDPFENTAAQIIKQASIETVNEAGDGTTTSTVLANEIIQNSQKYLLSGLSPVEMKRGMKKLSDIIVDRIKEVAVPISSKREIADIATISANGDKAIGELIADAVDSVGKDGSIMVENGKSTKTVLELVEGFRIESGLLSQYFVNREKQNLAFHKKPMFLITDHSIDAIETLFPVLEIALRADRALIIVSESIDGAALQACIYNAVKARQNMVKAPHVVAVKPPKYGEERKRVMEDLAISVGAKFISFVEGERLENVTLAQMGGADQIEINKRYMTVIGGWGNDEKINDRIESIKNLLSEEEDLYEAERIQERITRLSSGAAVILVGGETEIEVEENKYRIEDALEAVNSAREEGVVAGGGALLLRISESIKLEEIEFDSEDEMFGAKVLLNSIKAPFKIIARNASVSWEILAKQLLEDESEASTINFMTCEFAKSFRESGIIDPAKVVRVALQNAVSAASTLITTSVAIIEE